MCLDRLTAFNGVTITYDDAGNPISYYNGSAYTLTWQNGRELATATKGGVTSSYKYNIDGQRVQKTVGNVVYDYYYADGLLVRQTWGSNYIDFLYDESGVFSFVYNGTQYYYIKNLQGDVVAIANFNGTILVEYIYDAWGDILSITGTEAATLGAINPIRYRGYYFDTDTEFYYLNSRYYDPEIRRFINADTYTNSKGDFLGYNMYAYCVNNPVNHIDVNGDMPKWLAATLAVAAGALVAAAVVVALPAAACAIGMSAGIALGTASVIGGATTAAYVGGAVVAASAAAFTADSVYNVATGETVLLDTVFQGNTSAYQCAATLTTIGTASYLYAASVGVQSGACFVAGTYIITENGNIPIEEISIGDIVYAHNPDTGETSLKKVVNTFVRETTELVHIEVNGEELITTPNHPFYVPQKGWTEAIQLRAGDRLQLLNGEYVIIEQIQHEFLESPVTVYNFEVEEFHTYFVTDSAILVHNASCSGYKNLRTLQNKQIKGYNVSMDLERGGSGLTNIHLNVDNTKYFYQSGKFINSMGKELPNSLRNNQIIQEALRKALQMIENGW